MNYSEMSNKAKITGFGFVRDGVMKIINRDDFVKSVKALFPSGQFEVIVRKKRKHRSLQQNNYYWGVVVPLVRDGLKDSGIMIVTTEITHEFLKMKFLERIKIYDNSGEVTEIPGSTKDLTTSEMMDYIATIQIWGADFLNVNIPDPNEQIKIEFE